MAFETIMKAIARVRDGQWAGADDVAKAIRALRDGSMSVADFVTVLTMEGRSFTASVGTDSTPITFNAAFDADQPELAIDVPSGTTIIPVYLMVHLETSPTGGIFEVAFQTSTVAVGAGTSTAITPRNSRTDNPRNTLCSVYSAYSGNGTAPANTVEFFRGGYGFPDAAGDPQKRWDWSIHTHNPQIIVGPGSLVGYVQGSANAPTGFIKATWLELPSGALV